jgi:hypothetical protein
MRIMLDSCDVPSARNTSRSAMVQAAVPFITSSDSWGSHKSKDGPLQCRNSIKQLNFCLFWFRSSKLFSGSGYSVVTRADGSLGEMLMYCSVDMSNWATWKRTFTRMYSYSYIRTTYNLFSGGGGAHKEHWWAMRYASLIQNLDRMHRQINMFIHVQQNN